MDWPLQQRIQNSSDLNPINFLIWSWTAKRAPLLKSLKKLLEKVWVKISRHWLKISISLVSVKAKGGNFEHLFKRLQRSLIVEKNRNSQKKDLKQRKKDYQHFLCLNLTNYVIQIKPA